MVGVLVIPSRIVIKIQFDLYCDVVTISVTTGQTQYKKT